MSFCCVAEAATGDRNNPLSSNAAATGISKLNNGRSIICHLKPLARITDISWSR